MSLSKHAEETTQASTPIVQVADHMQTDDLRRAIRRSGTMCHRRVLHTREKHLGYVLPGDELFDLRQRCPGARTTKGDAVQPVESTYGKQHASDETIFAGM